MPAKVTEQPTRPSNVVSIVDALRKSIAVEAAKSTGAKPKAETPPAEDIASPKPKAPSKSKCKVAAAAPAMATQKTRKPSDLHRHDTLRSHGFRGPERA
jgi:hypothetical protein